MDQNGVAIAGALTVSAIGINETYGSPGARILKIGGPNGFGSTHGASFGQGHDTLLIATSVQQAADVSMGVGDDYAAGGAGNDLLHGDAGFDQLVGNGGNDKFLAMPTMTRSKVTPARTISTAARARTRSPTRIPPSP